MRIKNTRTEQKSSVSQKGGNTNINQNKIIIEMPKQRQYKPKQKSISQAEQELQNLENQDASYMAHPINVSVVQPPTINPSLYGYSHLPIQREVIESSRGETMISPPETVAPPPVEEAPIEVPKKRGGRVKGVKNKPKQIAIAEPASIPTGYYTDVKGGYDTGYESGYFTEPIKRISPQLAKFRERSNFPELVQSYVQSPLDIELAKQAEEKAKQKKPTKITIIKKPVIKSEGVVKQSVSQIEEKIKKGGRPKLTEEEKAQAKAKRDEAKRLRDEELARKTSSSFFTKPAGGD